MSKRQYPMGFCTECGESKPIEAKGKCRACYLRAYNALPHRRQAQIEYRRNLPRSRKYDYELRQKYGITLADFKDMRRAQKSRCLGCGQKRLRLVVDHCHATGVVRGLLCGPCNVALGRVRDNPTTLRNLANYLEATSR